LMYSSPESGDAIYIAVRLLSGRRRTNTYI